MWVSSGHNSGNNGRSAEDCIGILHSRIATRTLEFADGKMVLKLFQRDQKNKATPIFIRNDATFEEISTFEQRAMFSEMALFLWPPLYVLT